VSEYHRLKLRSPRRDLVCVIAISGQLSAISNSSLYIGGGLLTHVGRGLLTHVGRGLLTHVGRGLLSDVLSRTGMEVPVLG